MIDGFYATDLQVHSVRSHDGRATILEQCERAILLGLDVIGFSEHKDFDPQDPVVDYFDYDRYRAEIEEARARFGHQLTIRMGVEIDYQKWFEDQIRTWLEDHPFDFVIGSVHYVDRAKLMTPEYTRNRTREEAYKVYFDAVRHSVESGLIDIVGHLEYANRRGVPLYGPYDPSPYREDVIRIFQAMIARGVALEINTAGLRQGAGHTYPCDAHIKLYASLGGRLLTIGSDAHHPDDLAASYCTAADLALAAGLKSITDWQDRRPKPMPLRS
jgi:histidinol-phosphatase (PHP family)